MNIKLIFRSLGSIFVLFVCSAHGYAQTEHQKLTAIILHLDSAFWNAYNGCDTAHFKDFFTDDVEFYHDKGGITTGAKTLIESLKRNICGNVNPRIRREAVAATVKVYPMQNGNEIYGALISGEHLFYITEKGKAEYHSGVANFTQLWQLKNGTWKMSRILSYNHHEPGDINKRTEIELPGQQIDQLTGTYKSSQSGEMIATRENKVLVLKGGNNRYTLYPLSATSFFSKERDLVFEFIKDPGGRPVKMIVTEHGAVADELIFKR